MGIGQVHNKYVKGIIYILQSARNKRYYIGSTNDLNRRLAEHNSGKSKKIIEQIIADGFIKLGR